MQHIGDTKAGTYIATDKAGNKYYENLEQELPRLSPLPSPLHSPKTNQNNETPSLTESNTISTNEMGRLQAIRIRPRADRAGVARVDVVYSRQAADRGRGAEDGPEELGITRSQAELDHEQGGVQDLFDVSLLLPLFYMMGHEDCGEGIATEQKGRHVDWAIRTDARV